MKKSVQNRIRKELKDALNASESYVHTFISIQDDSKPIQIVNGMRNLATRDFSLLLIYAADHRRIQDRPIFNALNESTALAGFNRKIVGHDGASWSWNFGSNIEEVIKALDRIYAVLERHRLHQNFGNSIQSSFQSTDIIGTLEQPPNLPKK